MSENSEISWTHHTANFWSGCSKVSAGCANCYAAALPPSMRRGAVWGDGQERVLASDSYWGQPLKWNAKALAAKERHRVFAHSTSDVFEDLDALDPWRDRLLCLTQFTRGGLDWLLLTKRPEKALRYLTDPGLYDRLLVAAHWWRQRWPELGMSPIDNPQPSSFHVWYPNVWIGASVEDQRAADERIPVLLQVPARVRFLSMEPLLGFVNICAGLFTQPPEGEPDESPEAGGMWTGPRTLGAAGLSWVIAGGESGPRARPMNVSWVRGVRDQCVAAGVPFHFKQWGEWAPDWYRDDDAPPGTPWKQAEESMSKVGKKFSGRELDGRTWDEVPR